jgi:hypothetical protein
MTNKIILAEVHSDDHVFEVEFDATPWFEQASNEAIVALADCEWGGDYAADAVADFFSESNEQISDLFTYLHTIRNLRSHKDMNGFECHVNSEDAYAWLEANRPGLVAAVKAMDPNED